MPPRPSAGKEAPSLDSVLASAQAVTRSTRISLRGDLLAELDSLNEDFAQARLDDERLNRTPQAPAIAQKIVEKTEEARDSEIEFTFKAVGRRAWRDLAEKFPPTEAQKLANPQGDVDIDQFPLAAMALSCISPTGVTAEKFQELADRLTQTQYDQLWLTCHQANTGGSDVPFIAAAYAVVRPTETNSE